MGSLRRTLLVTLAVPTLAAAQSNAERVGNDAYTRSHDYDLVHQRIEVRDFDWDSTAFKGRVTTTLVALRPGLDSIILDAGKLLDIRRVTGDGTGAPVLRFTTHGDTLVFKLAASGDARDLSAVHACGPATRASRNSLRRARRPWPTAALRASHVATPRSASRRHSRARRVHED